MVLSFKSNKDISLEYRNGHFFSSGEMVGSIPLSKIRQLLSHIRLTNRLLRLEPRLAVALTEKEYMVVFQRKIFLLNISKKCITEAYPVREGFSNPLNICSMKKYGQAVAYWGDYEINEGKKYINIYKYQVGAPPKVCYTFKEGLINHVHQIIFDPYRERFIIFTGDFGKEVGIYTADNRFTNVEPLFVGNENFRACQGIVTEDGLLWATDAVMKENHLFYLSFNQPDKIRDLATLNGSVIYGLPINDGLLFSTTVESYPSNNRGFSKFLDDRIGPGIKSRDVDLMFVSKDLKVQLLHRFKKDCWPMRLFQYGQIQFPSSDWGGYYVNEVVVNPIAVKKYDGKPFFVKLK